MSNLEHLIENGLSLLDKGKSYREWRELMQQDCNWEGNENITIDNLWEVCQYVIFTWDSERLKEHEPKPVELHTNAYGTKFYFCPKCKRELFHTRNLNFCERCGQEVKWDD